jgi:hypothetical protein
MTRRSDKHGCYADWEHEQDAEARRLAHENFECAGVGKCDWCSAAWDGVGRSE